MSMSMIITNDGYIEVAIDEQMLYEAEVKSKEMGQLRNSIRNGQGNVAGFLGEEIVLRSFIGAKSDNTYQHDIKFNNITFEVKTKDRTVYPSSTYEASVAKFNTRQSADFYTFVSLLRKDNQYVKGYVLGIINKSEYFEKARFLKKGDYDPTNNWYCRADCYNLKYSALSNFYNWR